MFKPRVIALYLPQFHATPGNDEWHGKGFTEWTNVRKARQLFPQHNAPNEPSELGYYDLREPEIKEQQAALARQYGVEGFCYYHYWFGNGRIELETPLQQVLETGKPDLPFCLCWANESWHRKFWSPDGSSRNELLVEQRYPGKDDIVEHFHYCLRAFRDPRYIRVDGKPLFMIYKVMNLDNAEGFIREWQSLAREHGLPGIFFVGQTETLDTDEKAMMRTGLDGINTIRLFHYYKKRLSSINRFFRKMYWRLAGLPRMTRYEDASAFFVSENEYRQHIYPSIIPNWDHTPRSGLGGTVLTGSTPELFRKHVIEALTAVRDKPADQQLIFVKSWNEWGEGNYLEPDKKHGRQYLEALKSAIDEVSAEHGKPSSP